MDSAEFFTKLARYAGQKEPPQTIRRRLAMLLGMTLRVARSGRRILAFDRPAIVVGGCGRSGTTLVLSMLSAHPNIFSIPMETLALCPTAYSEKPRLESPPDLRKLYRVLLLHDIPSGRRRWCEKTPKNVHVFGQILDRLAGVRILNMVRDGRDVVTSRHPTDPGKYWVPPQRWVRDVRAGRRVEDHPQVLTVRYEDLVGDVEPTLRGICGFLGEDFPETMLRWHEHATVRASAAWFSGVRPIHRESVERWRRPEHAAVVEELMRDEEAVALLRHYRYL